MPNETLAEAAIHGVTDDNFTGVPGMCEKFARESIQSALGDKYDGYFEGTAADTARAFRDNPPSDVQVFRGEPDGGYQDGDVIYKLEDSDPPSGHVGIVCQGGTKVCENSVTQIGRVSGAKGYRTLAEWPIEDCRVTVRFPDPNILPLLVIGYAGADGEMKFTPMVGAIYDLAAQHWTVNVSQLAAVFGIAGPGVRLSLRDALTQLGFHLASYADEMAAKQRFYAYPRPGAGE